MTATIESVRSATVNNAKTWANKFKASFLEAGIVSYENNGCGKVLLTHETIARCAKSFIGRPVIIRHSFVTPDTMEEAAQGYISDVWFDEKDGWWWCSGTLHKDEAKELIRRGQSVSCSYKVVSTGLGGSYHDIPYEEEITDFDGMHLAIVPDPRYERARILLNSKTKMFKIIKKLLSGEQKDNSASAGAPEEISGDSVIETPTGAATVASLVEKWNSAEDVEVEGKKVKMNDLISGYLANEKSKADAEAEKAKENSSEKEEKKEEKEEKKEETKENEAGKEDEKKEEIKDNSGGFFRTLMNAQFTVEEAEKAPSCDTLEDRLARARERYGFKKNT